MESFDKEQLNKQINTEPQRIVENSPQQDQLCISNEALILFSGHLCFFSKFLLVDLGGHFATPMVLLKCSR